MNSPRRSEYQSLLKKLKETAEAILESQPGYVWAAFGALNRLSGAIEHILRDRLRESKGEDGLFLFARGLKWLEPALASAGDQASQEFSPGLARCRSWLKLSLEAFSLTTQLKCLAGSTSHVAEFFHADAFVRQDKFFEGACTCIRAVEENNISLLLKMNPVLVHQGLRSSTFPALGMGDSDASVRHRRTSLPVPSLESSGSWRVPKRSSTPVSSVSRDVRPASVTKASGDPSLASQLKRDLDSSFDERGVDSGKGLVELGVEGQQESSSSRGKDLRDSGSLADEGSRVVARTEDDGIRADTGLDRKEGQLRDPTQKVSSPPWNNGVLSPADDTATEGGASSMGHSDVTEHERARPNLSPNTSLGSSVPRGTDPGLLQRVIAQQASAGSLESSGEVARHPPPPVLASSLQEASVLAASSSSSPGAGLEGCGGEGERRKRLYVKSGNKGLVVRKTHARSRSDFDVEAIRAAAVREEGEFRAAKVDRPDTSMREGGRLTRNDSVLSDGGGRASFFPRPREGQSLRAFLSSRDFQTCAELDRENAHFGICEALIAAIEQMKWNKIIGSRSEALPEEEVEESDEEIQQLKQRIRLRRRERMKEKFKGFPAFNDGPSTITESTSSTYSLDQWADYSGDDSSSSEGVDDTEVSGKSSSNLQSLHSSGLSLSMASMYSAAELHKQAREGERLDSFSGSVGTQAAKDGDGEAFESTNSAEVIAISLLKKFSEKQLPKASDLEWLVSEQDAPQELLPLPTSFPANPDDGENADLLRPGAQMRLRGNLDWAPPRPQIIFNILPPPKLKVMVASQNYRCAGCGTKVDPGYMKRLRYCEYMGKYFCQCCHNNASAVIPARVLHKWNFGTRPVSNFAKELLSRIRGEPLFNVEDINAGLMRRVTTLYSCCEVRRKLHHAVRYVNTCRLATELQQELTKSPAHWAGDTHLWSIDDLYKVKSGELLTRLNNQFSACSQHVVSCPLCQVKGFFCELCRSDDVIYPFQLDTVTVCSGCQACFHKCCFTPDKCPRCARRDARKTQLEAALSVEEEA